MAWPQISRVARTAVVARLSDNATGFNPNLVTAMADADVEAPIGWRLPIDFGEGSQNFFQGDLNPEDIDSTTGSTYPALTLFSQKSANVNDEKFRLFAGPVLIKIRFFASWTSGSSLPDFETIGDCVEESFYETFNDNSPAIVQWSTGPNTLYNGEMSIDRSRLIKGGENWSQQFLVSLQMEVLASSFLTGP